jgi:glutathione-regulated potassium-efflux system protein KefB
MGPDGQEDRTLAIESGAGDLLHVVALLGAMIVAVPLFRRLGLGSVLGYLAAGLAIGPFGFALFTDPQAILHVAELGVVMFLFIVGLEMQPSRLWTLRKQIFGLGSLQVVACGALLTGVGRVGGLSLSVAFVAAMGFVLTSTAIVMQIIEERGVAGTEPAQRLVSILLLEDLAIVPLLAVVALIEPEGVVGTVGARWAAVGIGLGTVAALVAVGLWLLNPFFSVLAKSGAREIMTAAALLVVLGAALLMQLNGLSMALGAFVAGVLLSESTFRHQLEAEIEPFRGLLLGLFFLGVGMALDLGVIATDWRSVLVWVLAFMVFKAAAIYAVARVVGAPRREAVYRSALMAQGGEFAFVLYSSASAGGIFDPHTNVVFTTVVIASMALTPLVMLLVTRLLRRTAAPSMDGVDVAEDLAGNVLVIGFGRFGQIASQALLARNVDVSIIDNDTDMIRAAAGFGFKVYYGDGKRLDVLHASGAGKVRAIAVCVEKQEDALKIAELVRHEFPLVRLLVRAFDRGHALKLLDIGVDFQIRETLESALVFSEAALLALDFEPAEAAETVADVRRRDAERLSLQLASGDFKAGRDLLRGNVIRPAPLTPAAQERQPLGDQVVDAPPT